MTRPIRVAATLALLTLSLAACDKPGPLSAVERGADPRPTLPQWAPPYLQAQLAETFPNTMACAGAIDRLGVKYKDARELVGWAWNTEAKQPVARVVAVNRKGRFVGFGEGGLRRDDVQRNRADVTSQTVGWTLVTGAPAPNGVRIFGIDPDRKAACLIGEMVVPG